MHSMLPKLRERQFPAIRRQALETVQVNLGYRCNQRCLHCHVNAGPTRHEQMDRDTAEQVLAFLRQSAARNLDITGGAPELNPNFRHLVSEARHLGLHVMDRCNLTVIEEPGCEDLPEFLARHQVEVFASLPCYLEENVDGQRGEDVFRKSLRALKKLNAVGYGGEGGGLVLNLVYNPTGAFLPPPQAALEADYRRELGQRYGIVFNRLFAIANMPIMRFGSTLVSKGEFGDYMHLLQDAFREENLHGVMCRSLISIDWQGHVFDCDFNQMLELPLRLGTQQPKLHISELSEDQLLDQAIVVADHCYGCTAGQGSGCGGAL